MSGAAVQLVKRLRGVDATERLLLLEVAVRQLETTGWARCRLGVELEGTGLSRRTLIYVLGDLERMGLLEVRRAPGRTPLLRIPNDLLAEVHATGRRGARRLDPLAGADPDQGVLLMTIAPVQRRCTPPIAPVQPIAPGGCNPLHPPVQPVAPVSNKNGTKTFKSAWAREGPLRALPEAEEFLRRHGRRSGGDEDDAGAAGAREGPGHGRAGGLHRA